MNEAPLVLLPVAAAAVLVLNAVVIGGRPVRPGMIVWLPKQSVQATGPADIVNDGNVITVMPPSLVVIEVISPN
jgi:hypothetical protein